MISALKPATELDAVNLMLDTVGEPPINTLENPTDEDVALATRILAHTNRLFQAMGWNFNTEHNYPLQRDGNNEIVLPTNAARVDATYAYIDVAMRGNRLYNKAKRSFKFDSDVNVDVVWLLPYEDMPQSARDYVAISAARRFQRRVQGDSGIEAYTQAEELQALSAMIDEDAEADDTNVFNHPSAGSFINRSL